MGLTVIDWTDASSFDAAAARAAIARDGAFLVRGLLSADEIAAARGQVRSWLTDKGERIQLGKTQPNAAVLVPEIGWLVGHPAVAAVFDQLLDGDVCFTGHCDIHMNMLSGWHKDSGESVGGYFSGDYFAANECNVYKAAVYLQDATASDGLTVRLGSHRHRGHGGETQHVPSRAGDVVFFDVRISHIGQAPDAVEKGIKALARPATGPNRIEPAWATSLRSAWWRLIGRRDRLSVFFTYGRRNAFTADFARANMTRQHAQAGEADTVMPPPLAAALESSGIALVEFGDAPALRSAA